MRERLTNFFASPNAEPYFIFSCSTFKVSQHSVLFYERYLRTQNIIEHLYCKFLQHKKSRAKIFDEILLKEKKLKLKRGRDNIVYRNFCTHTLALSHNSSKGNGKPLFKHKQSPPITNSKACSIPSQGRNTIKINKRERN